MSAPISNDRPLSGVRVLVTRSASDAPVLRRRLEAQGATVIELPTIAIEPPSDPMPLDTALRRLAQYDWLVFTSRNAVAAVWDRSIALGLSIETPARIAAVGPSTREALEAHGLAVSCTPELGTASDLQGALIAAGIEGKLILLPVGDLARPALAGGLRAAGAKVDEVIAYRTIKPLETRREALEAIRRGAIDVITLASPSAMDNLAAMLGADVRQLQYAAIVCIGPTTAAAVRKLGLEPAAEARERTLDGLVRAVIAVSAGKVVS